MAEIYDEMIEPFFDQGGWGIATARQTEQELYNAGGTVEAMHALGRYVMRTHPYVLDLPTAASHRYQQARQLATRYANGAMHLQAYIADYYRWIGNMLNEESAVPIEASIPSLHDPSYPAIDYAYGMMFQRLTLPPGIAERSVQWNQWIFKRIAEGDIDQSFTSHPNWPPPHGYQ